MIDILRPIVELAIIFPGTLLAYIPMKNHIKFQKRKFATIGTIILTLLCVLGGSMCYFLKIRALWISVPLTLIISIIYCNTLKLSYWKSISIVLAICGVFACFGSVTRAIDSMFVPYNPDPWFCLNAGLIYNLICWLFVIFAWYPATHAVPELLEEEGIAQTWYIFWILPIVFIAMNLFMIPINPGILFQGRIMQGYIVISLTFLLLMLLFYVLFYFMARSLNKNDRLRQKNQFLSMQQVQYETLRTAIEETRHARHDMRHHFSVISSLVNRKEWQQIENYLAQALKNIPNTELKLCDNPAVDGVISHYCLRYKENNIPFSIELNLPYKLPISDIDICLVLSNLLENALEASLRTNELKRKIKIQSYLHSENIIILIVENFFDGTVKEKDGVFQSSKRRGDGVGLQSVRRIAEKNGGYCKFVHENSIFCANIMLRGECNVYNK